MWISYIISVALVAGFTSTAPAPTPLSLVYHPRQSVCNGQASYCDRKYSNVTLIGTHDSAFVGSILDPAINQEETVTQQLDAGIRFLQAQTHNNAAGILSMCHTSCLELDAGPLQSYLTTVKTWLDANPTEVLTLLLVNGDFLEVGNFSAAFQSSGIKDYAFVPSTSPKALAISQWPTYAELIAAGTRLVAFLDYDANTTAVPYILPEFDGYFFETPYDVTNATFLNCSLNRPPGATPDGRMYIVNHFLDVDVLDVLIPDNAADYNTNAATGPGSIGAQVAACEDLYGRPPNFVLVDMFDRGNVLAAQDTLNGVS